MTGIFTSPVERNEALWARGLDAYPATRGEAIAASFEESLLSNPAAVILRRGRREQFYPGFEYDTITGQFTERPAATPSAMIEPDQANARFGIEGELKWSAPVPEPVAAELHQMKRDELARRDVIARSPGGIAQGAGQLAAGLAATIADPINIGAAFIPVVGQARYALWLERAAGALGRARVRAGAGAVEGFVGAAAVEPIVYFGRRAEQADYTAADSLLNLAFGTALGGGLHAGFGALGDRFEISGFARSEAGRARLKAKAAALTQAVGDMAEGRAVNVAGRLDEAPPWREGEPWPADILDARARAAAIPETHAIATPEREELREGIANALYGRGAGLKMREAHVVLGAPGAGKSTAVAGPMAEARHALVIDADMAKARLPEYQGGLGARAVHRESDLIRDAVLQRALAAGDNIVTAITGSTQANAEALMRILTNNGYQVHLHFVGLPLDKSIQRVIARFREQGRFVDPDYVRRVGDKPRATFEVLKHDFRIASWSEYDNDVARGQRPRATGGGRNNVTGRLRRDLRPDSGRERDRVDGQAGGLDRGPAQEGAAAQATRSKQGGLSARFTSTGRKVEVRYKVVEIDDLITSHTDDFAPNPKFPPSLQPRQRTRAVSGEQIVKIAADLNPELLGPSPHAGDGAPIVGPDLVVESGNARALGLRRAYLEDLPGAEAYRAKLKADGHDIEGMSFPILVAERATPMDPAERAAFTIEANLAGTLKLSEAEQALADARLVGDELLALLRPGEIGAEANRPFRLAFLDALPQAQRGDLVDKDGFLSQAGKRRMENALLARAYGDPEILARLLESTDENLRAIAGALIDAAPDWARMRAASARGVIDAEFDVTADLIAAVRLIDRARREGTQVKALADQMGLFGDELTPQARFFLQQMFRDEGLSKPRGREAVANELSDFAARAIATPSGPTLFGEAMPAIEGRDILAAQARGRVIETTPTDEGPPAAPPADRGQPLVAPSQAAKPGTLAPKEKPAQAGPADAPAKAEAPAAGEAQKLAAEADNDLKALIEAGEIEKNAPELAALKALDQQAADEAKLADAAGNCLKRGA